MEDDLKDPSPTTLEPPEVLKDLLTKIEHNTAVVRGWVRFFGWMWVLGAFATLLLWASRTGEATVNLPNGFLR